MSEFWFCVRPVVGVQDTVVKMSKSLTVVGMYYRWEKTDVKYKHRWNEKTKQEDESGGSCFFFFVERLGHLTLDLGEVRPVTEWLGEGPSVQREQRGVKALRQKPRKGGQPGHWRGERRRGWVGRSQMTRPLVWAMAKACMIFYSKSIIGKHLKDTEFCVLCLIFKARWAVGWK